VTIPTRALVSPARPGVWHRIAGTLVIGTLIGLTACQPAGVSVSSGERSVDLTRIAKVVVAPGASKVLGTVRLPRAIMNQESAGKLDDLVMVPGTTLRLVDEQGTPIAGTSSQLSDTGGGFAFSHVPLGVSMTLEAEVAVGGKTLRLKKLLRPTEALTCAHVDLATTLVADQLLSASPLLAPDAGLELADLYNLFLPSRLLDAEARVRRNLQEETPGSLDGLLTRLSQGDASPKMGELVLRDPGLTTAYMDIFERPDSSLAINIKTSAIGTNSIGVENRHLIFGVISLKVVGAPNGTARIEYWTKSDTQRKIAESTTPGTWEATVDTWTLPDGNTTLDTVAILDSGKKVLVARSYLTIQNTVANVCPLP
jgi:hypothetical protein